MFYITFGSGTFLADYYLKIKTSSEIIARRKIIELLRGNHIWCGCYDEETWNKEVKVYYPAEWQELKVLRKGIMEITDYEEKEMLRLG